MSSEHLLLFCFVLPYWLDCEVAAAVAHAVASPVSDSVV